MRYVLLAIGDDQEADDLLLDLAEHPGRPLLTPVAERDVHAELVVATERVERPGPFVRVPAPRPEVAVPAARVPDPEALLARILTGALGVADRGTPADDVTGQLAGDVETLDAHLVSGGRLPASWSAARP